MVLWREARKMRSGFSIWMGENWDYIPWREGCLLVGSTDAAGRVLSYLDCKH